MKYNPDIHHRRSIRLPHYDYSQVGYYFVTICINERLYLFGNIENNTMILNDAGKMVEIWYQETQNKFVNIRCLDHIVMPNHFHCIWQNTGENLTSLSTVVQWFKTMTTNTYIRGVKQQLWEPFYKKLWQRNYYEHVIRNE